MPEALILLAADETDALERALPALERLGARPLAVFPPVAIVASVPSGAYSALATVPQVAKVFDGAVPQDTIDALSKTARAAALGWNERVRSAAVRGGARRGEGERWDAPGRQPPDIPQALRDELERRNK
jgi:hypothetical protein